MKEAPQSINLNNMDHLACISQGSAQDASPRFMQPPIIPCVALTVQQWQVITKPVIFI